ncbi:MAG: MlaD family protein [Thermodesulfobacteriota bacterium]
MAKKLSGSFSLTPEAKVGLFVLLGIILLVYMSLRIGGFRLGKAEGYRLYATFDSAAGLDPDSSVKVAGVEVGRVKSITLKGHQARILLQIHPDVEIGKDFTAMLKSTGLLGEKYIEIVPGAPGAPALKDGEEITRTAKYMDIDRLLGSLTDLSGDMKKLAESLGNTLGGPEGENTVRNIVRNVDEISSRVNKLLARNDARLNRIIANFDDLSTNLKGAVDDINSSLTRTSDNLNQVITENRGNLKEGIDSLKTAAVKLQEAMETVQRVADNIGPGVSETVESLGSIAKKIDAGQGTLGKLVNDKEMHENLNKTISGINNYIEKTESFHIFLGYRGEYLFDEKDVKSYLSLRIQPKPDKYYLFEVVDDPRGQVEEKTDSTIVGSSKTTQTTTTISDKVKFSAEIAKSFGRVTLRGGLIESAAGVGIDYALWKNRFKLTFEAFDFNQTGNPHLKAGGTFHINKYFYITAGADDFISRIGLGSAYMGLGLEFRDDDLKLLFSSAPPISFQ